MTRRALSAVAILVVFAIAGMLWFRGGCTPETCGPLVGSEMRNLVARQETYRAQHGAFATTLDELGATPAPPVRLELVHTDSEGWIARGTHDQLEGLGCVAWMGTIPTLPATPRGARAEEEGRVYCDFPT